MDGVDYGLIAAFGIATGIVDGVAKPNPTAVIGRSYNPSQPSVTPQDAPSIGKSYKNGDTVPASATIVAAGVIGVGLAGIGAYDAYASKGHEHREVHDLLVGYADALVLTLFTTELGKFTFGRLRPDFLGRVEVYDACVSKSGASKCATEKKALDDGHVSFPSGHTAFSFAMANYAALAIGGRFVWGDKGTSLTVPLGVGSQVVLLGLAGWVGVTRVDDHHHNPSDVMAGMGVGLLWSNLAYWRRFDSRGRPRRAWNGIDIVPGPGDAGAALSGKF